MVEVEQLQLFKFEIYMDQNPPILSFKYFRNKLNLIIDKLNQIYYSETNQMFIKSFSFLLMEQYL